jgi:hypothetical protein
MNKLTDFAKGIITGVLCSVMVLGIFYAFSFFQKRDKELFEYVEKQQAIENLREDYVNRDPDEFLELPGVRGAVDGAAVEFLRKRDEAVQRLRSGHPD